jgi:hypothetical protein
MSLVCNANVVAMFRMVERLRSVRVMIGMERSYSDRGGMIMIDKGHGNLSLVGQDDDNNPSLCNTFAYLGADGEEVTLKRLDRRHRQHRAGY